jgi:hypothetical protein
MKRQWSEKKYLQEKGTRSHQVRVLFLNREKENSFPATALNGAVSIDIKKAC